MSRCSDSFDQGLTPTVTHTVFMQRAITLARLSFDEGEVPVGAVIVQNGVIIAEGRNRRELGKNALYHAEMEAIHNACKALGGWRLPGCTLYVTLEPCPMCAGAIINSRIENLVFGAYDKKAGCAKSVIRLFDYPYNHKPQIKGGFMEEECADLLSRFFEALRTKRKENNKQ